MLDKNSSFGSTSLVPSLSNLPPIQVLILIQSSGFSLGDKKMIRKMTWGGPWP
uniref:Uncharacterized protein n=1 Tax=Triticum urartu TaxID=4572 RepID=A0A8R7UUE9_TRIUA